MSPSAAPVATVHLPNPIHELSQPAPAAFAMHPRRNSPASSQRLRRAGERDIELIRQHAPMFRQLITANKKQRRQILQHTHKSEPWARAIAALTRMVVATGHAKVPRGLQSKVNRVMGAQRSWKTLATAIGGRPGATHATGEGFFQDLAHTASAVAPFAPLIMKML